MMEVPAEEIVSQLDVDPFELEESDVPMDCIIIVKYGDLEGGDPASARIISNGMTWHEAVGFLTEALDDIRRERME